MASVSTTRPTLYDPDMRTAKPASALKVTHPATVAINHHLGHLLGGVRVLQTNSGLPQTTGGSLRYKIDRHPNCDHLAVLVVLRNMGQTGPTCTVKAGTGDLQTYTFGSSLTGASVHRRVLIMAPWGNDADTQELIVSTANIGIQSLTVSDWPRLTLNPTTDDSTEYYDSTYPRCGTREEDSVTESDEAGGESLLAGVRDAWNDNRQQIIAWADMRADPIAVSGDAYVNPLIIEFKRRAPQKHATDTRTTCAVHVYTEKGGAPANTYDVKVTSSNPGAGADDNAEATGLTNTALAWQSIGDVEVDCTADASIKVELKTDNAAGAARIGGLCVIKKKE